MKVLLTNDDGIAADGIEALRRALVELPRIELLVVAPDGNRSATARSITTRRPLWVEEVDFDDGSIGYATDGTPVDCVRLTQLGIVDGFVPDLVVSGINHGLNIGDDVTYSGTVAAAFEALLLKLPGIAVSQQSTAQETDFRQGVGFDFSAVAAFTARLVQELDSVPLQEGTLLNVNAPGRQPTGVEVTRLGKRFYRDALELSDEAHPRRRQFRIYGDAGELLDDEGTDIAAVAAGAISVTPIHFDLTSHSGLEPLRGYDLEALIAPAARDIE
ncbi:MAG TPA: 5'/3'-nucleotidase SurE [Conexibacter sp.]|jgi:5'-nucleotidase